MLLLQLRYIIIIIIATEAYTTEIYVLCSSTAATATSDVSELVQNEGKTVRAYNYISGLYPL